MECGGRSTEEVRTLGCCLALPLNLGQHHPVSPSFPICKVRGLDQTAHVCDSVEEREGVNPEVFLFG